MLVENEVAEVGRQLMQCDKDEGDASTQNGTVR
jgi:hypothetical protein